MWLQGQEGLRLSSGLLLVLWVRATLLPPVPSSHQSSTDNTNPGSSRRRCGAWGASPKGADREQEGGLQCLGAKFSSALFWVTTFTMFLHPESFRLPARLRCFQLMGSHAYLTTGLVQGLPSSLTAAPQSPTVQQDAQVLGWPECRGWSPCGSQAEEGAGVGQSRGRGWRW